MPVALQSSKHGKAKKSKKTQDHHNVFAGAIDQEQYAFKTRSFMIRYQEEEVELNDICHFRIEIDLATNSMSTTEFCLEVDLMFCDLVTFGGPEKFQSSRNLIDLDPELKFKSVQTRKFNIRRLAEGVFEYVPVVFEEQHFCISLCTVHSTLLNFHHPHNVKDEEGPGKEPSKLGVTEWLFADESGKIAEDANL
jgi:hypothetical protein